MKFLHLEYYCHRDFTIICDSHESHVKFFERLNKRAGVSLLFMLD